MLVRCVLDPNPSLVEVRFAVAAPTDVESQSYAIARATVGERHRGDRGVGQSHTALQGRPLKTPGPRHIGRDPCHSSMPQSDFSRRHLGSLEGPRAGQQQAAPRRILTLFPASHTVMIPSPSTRRLPVEAVKLCPPLPCREPAQLRGRKRCDQPILATGSPPSRTVHHRSASK